MHKLIAGFFFLPLAAGLSFAACADDEVNCDVPASSSSSSSGGATFNSSYEAITVLAFDDAGTLYVADSGVGQIHAVTPPAGDNPAAGQPYNLRNIDTTIAQLLDTSRDTLRIRDMAVHPTSTEAYLAVARPNGSSLESTIVVLNQTGEARLLEETPTSSVTLPFAPADDFSFYDDFPSRDLSITDLTIYQGVLYAAGMSNADFASTLWSVPLPFSGDPTVTTVEIYHGVHGQTETRAPIRSMAIADIGGEPTVLAAYTCTPLVAFPLSAIQNGAHISGKTIGELGYGNTPGDMITFDGQDMAQNPIPMLFIQNKNQGAQVIPMAAIGAAVAQPGIEAPLGLAKVDLGALETPMTNILHVDDLDPGRLLTIRRDAEEGDLELMSYLKNVYFRISDFQSEYEVPNYEYQPEQEQIKQLQNMMKVDEGRPQDVVE